MKLCQITRENYSVFEPFIPDKLGHIRNDRRCLSLGFYEDKTPMGAVILLANNTVLEVHSLEHMPEVENGICEKELADFVVDQNWPGIYKIEYIVGGTEDFLKEYDFIMLDIGFFPMDSDVRKFSASLYDIVKAQGQTVNSFKIAEGHREDSQYVLGKNLTKHQLDSYNNMYPYNRYYPDEKNKELSCFLIKNGEPVAGITIAEVDDGKLEFQWMDARGQTPQEIMKLLFHTLVNALEKYPRGTEVIICPFTEEVKSLISRFGFSETPENIRTRVYSYYL